eukprot:6251820-Amphidinium_carterae.1
MSARHLLSLIAMRLSQTIFPQSCQNKNTYHQGIQNQTKRRSTTQTWLRNVSTNVVKPSDHHHCEINFMRLSHFLSDRKEPLVENCGAPELGF